MQHLKIACVIVTFNRKNLLKNCLEAVQAQTQKPDVVYILDNASTDGTIDSVKEWGFYDCYREGVEYKYILNSMNEGGAGGFYLGMKTAFMQSSPDALWVMDDDGVPDNNCLAQLKKHLGSYHFISPMVVSSEDPKQMAFFDCSVESFKEQTKNGLFVGEANPFNGVLFSKQLIEAVGYPQKEMFIWGDERNYMLRAIKKAFELVIVSDAIHVHPKDRQVKVKALNNYICVSDVDWKLYCLLRNTMYNGCVQYSSRLKRIKIFTSMLFNYLFYYGMRKHDLSRCLLIIDAVWHGLNSRFDGMSKYSKKK